MDFARKKRRKEIMALLERRDGAIYKTLEQIKPARVVFFTDIGMSPDGIDVINIKHLYSKDDYSKVMIKELGKYEFQTSHLLIIQHDGYVLDGEQWTDEFLEYADDHLLDLRRRSAADRRVRCAPVLAIKDRLWRKTPAT